MAAANANDFKSHVEDIQIRMGFQGYTPENFPRMALQLAIARMILTNLGLRVGVSVSKASLGARTKLAPIERTGSSPVAAPRFVSTGAPADASELLASMHGKVARATAVAARP